MSETGTVPVVDVGVTVYTVSASRFSQKEEVKVASV